MRREPVRLESKHQNTEAPKPYCHKNTATEEQPNLKLRHASETATAAASVTVGALMIA